MMGDGINDDCVRLCNVYILEVLIGNCLIPHSTTTAVGDTVIFTIITMFHEHHILPDSAAVR